MAPVRSPEPVRGTPSTESRISPFFIPASAAGSTFLPSAFSTGSVLTTSSPLVFSFTPTSSPPTATYRRPVTFTRTVFTGNRLSSFTS